MGVQRYREHHGFDFDGMVEADDGEFVGYADLTTAAAVERVAREYAYLPWEIMSDLQRGLCREKARDLIRALLESKS